MKVLCFKCGHLNIDTLRAVCENCNTDINLEQHNRLKNFAKHAVRFGYQYRLAYEQELALTGSITKRYSLLTPSNYLELIAVSALSGVVGNLVYDLGKFVAQQVWDKLNQKHSGNKLTEAEKEAFKIVSDEQELRKFIDYVLDYYRGVPLPDEQVSNVIGSPITDERKPTSGELEETLIQLKKDLQNNNK